MLSENFSALPAITGSELNPSNASDSVIVLQFWSRGG